MRCWGYSLFAYLIFLCSCERNEIFEQSRDNNLCEECEYLFVLGDIQEYTANKQKMDYYNKTISWIGSQCQYFDACAIIQTGDITANNHRDQWSHFYSSTHSIADNIPFISCVGNHDYDWNNNLIIESRESTLFSQYTAFSVTLMSLVEVYQHEKMENSVYKLHINNKEFRILTLEYGTRPAVVNWALSHVKNNPHINYIILTHEFLSANGERLKYYCSAQEQFKEDYLFLDQVWETFISECANIKAVICGHNGFNKVLYSDNKYGKSIPQVLFNLQYQENGGNGYVELWEFSKNSNNVYMSIYDTINREFLTEKVLLFSYN